MTIRVIQGDCLIELPKLAAAAERFHAVVTDPPYGLEFMGREWDGADGFRRSLNEADAGRDSVHGRTSRRSPEYRATPLFQQWCEAWARAVYDVLLPGAYLFAFGGTRTSHRLVCAIEDAGFEIRDTVAWLYGSGFPKSLDVSKAIDRAAGAHREIVGTTRRKVSHGEARSLGGLCGTDTFRENPNQPGNMDTRPATPEAATWQGWGTRAQARVRADRGSQEAAGWHGRGERPQAWVRRTEH